MGLRINTNIAALNAHRHLTITDTNMQKSLERLSSGYRINHASDDAAGLAIANRFRASIRSLYVAQRNITEATSVVQVAEGAANQIQSILERLKELATQAASDNVSDTDRTKIDNEATQLETELDRIANSTKYQGTHLINGHYGDYVSETGGINGTGLETSGIVLNGASTGSYTISETASAGGPATITITNGTITQTVTVDSDGQQTINFDALNLKLTLDSDFDVDSAQFNGATFTISSGSGGVFQVGDGNDPDQDRIAGIDFGDLTVSSLLGSANGVDLTSRTNAETAINTIDSAINTLAEKLGNMGAYMNRLSYASANLSVTIENYSASESVIRDVDMAFEMTNLTKNQILLQAGTAMLAQANMAPQQVLALFS